MFQDWKERIKDNPCSPSFPSEGKLSLQVFKKHVLKILCALFVVVHLSAKEIVVAYPAFSVRQNDAFEIEKIMLNEKSTTIQIRGNEHGLDFIDSVIYLNIGGKEYPLQYSVKLDSLDFEDNLMAQNGLHLVPFSLVFPPIPAKTERFDLYTRSRDWVIWDVEMKKPKKYAKPSTAHIPTAFMKAVPVKDDGQVLEPPRWNLADAHLKGLFAGYKPEMNFWIELFPNNMIMGYSGKRCLAEVKSDGTFEIDVPVQVSRQVWFRIMVGNEDTRFRDSRTRDIIFNQLFAGFIVLTPDEETRICFDLPAYFRKKSLIRYDRQADPKICYFDGANAEINNLYYDASYDNYTSIISKAANEEIDRMTPSAYKERVLQAKNQCLADINIHPALTLKTKEFFRLNLEYHAASCLDNIQTTIAMARNREEIYTQADAGVDSSSVFKVNRIERIYPPLDMNKEYYSYINDLPLNDPVSLYFVDYESRVSRGGFITVNQEQTPLSAITGTSEGLFYDLLKCREISASLSYQPLSEANMERLKQLKEPFYKQIILTQNEEILARIESNKLRYDYHVYNVQDIENDKLFEAIIGKEKGKVVLVDFWADSATPFFPFVKHKDEFDPEQVVFVYLTDETTPIERWNYIIPDFSGEHYRLTKQQYEYMKKQFHLGLHTSLVLLDKNHDKIDFTTNGLFFSFDTILDKIHQNL